MRTDQYDRLKQLSEQLTDVVLIEGEAIKRISPAREPDQGKSGAQYHNAERRLHWRKKNTMATLGILMRIQSLVGIIERAGAKHQVSPAAPADMTPEEEAEATIESVEKEVEQILDGLRKRRDE